MLRKWTITTSLTPREEGPYEIDGRYYVARNVRQRGQEYVYEFAEISELEYRNFEDIRYIVDSTIQTESTYAEGYNAAVTLMDVEAPTVASAEAMRPVLMKAVASLDDAEASVVPTFFPDWDGNSHEHKVGDRVRYGDTLYKCIQAHTSLSTWDPVHAPSLWARTDDPAIEWPEWVRPLGTHDAYAKGAKVSHNGKHWISNTPNNTWEPGVYGWDEVKE